MDVQPLFSVIVPTYNRAARIHPTLQSIVDQTLDDWEAIIVDDGSADGDALEAAVAGMKDPRFSYVRRQNGGGSAARNTGIDLARGRYIAFLDSDDLFVPKRLEKAAERLAGTNGEDVVVYSQFQVERGVGKRWVRPDRGPLPGERVDEYLMCTDGNVQTSTVSMPAALAKRVRFNENLPSSQDTDFAVRCASAGARFIFIPEGLVIFDDVHDPTRVSRQKRLGPIVAWIDSMRGVHISDRAYYGYRGWHCARIASYNSRIQGLGFYLPSMLRGSYAPVQAIRIGAQVLIPQTVYQRIVNLVVAAIGRRARG